MASNEEILKQIALLSGALNQQRHGNGRSFHPYISARPGHNRTLINNRPIRNGAAGGRIPEQRPAQASTGVSSTYIPSRNRTLVVVNNGTPSPTPRTPEQTDISATLSSAPVSYVRKGNKLVRVGCAASPKQPRPRKSIRKAAATLVELDGKTYKKSSDGKRLIASGIRTPKPAKRTLNINGVTFSRSGNKLIRQPDSGQKVDNTGTPQTPKRVLFKGVPYVRSKKGNLVLRRLTSRDYCPKYRYGRCTRGQGCKFIHDPRRLAVCPGLIYKGACTRESCALSHAPDH
ncbi:hypothetical protein BC832DRAFT_352660 [Gaertneriomyces semiglobifer]|nr:hypothetical protein BC832DRAFT_352660 [Gaertneriomyces semiglobifer]